MLQVCLNEKVQTRRGKVFSLFGSRLGAVSQCFIINNSFIAARSIEMGREEATNVSQTLEEASSGKSQTAATARTAVNSNPFNDIKLSMKCEVKLKNWSAAEIRDYRHGISLFFGIS